MRTPAAPTCAGAVGWPMMITRYAPAVASKFLVATPLTTFEVRFAVVTSWLPRATATSSRPRRCGPAGVPKSVSVRRRLASAATSRLFSIASGFLPIVRVVSSKTCCAWTAVPAKPASTIMSRATYVMTMLPCPSARSPRQRLERALGGILAWERLVAVDRLLELGARFVFLAVGEQRHCQVIVHERVVGSCYRRAPQVGDRLADLALPITHPAVGVEVRGVVGVAEVAHELLRLRVAHVVVAIGREQHREVVRERRRLRIRACQALVDFDRAFRLAVALVERRQIHAERRVRARVLEPIGIRDLRIVLRALRELRERLRAVREPPARLHADGLLGERERPVEVAVGQADLGEQIHRHRVIWIRREHALEAFFGFGPAIRRHEHAGERAQRLGAARSLRERQLVALERARDVAHRLARDALEVIP